jgi:hypothetical protein
VLEPRLRAALERLNSALPPEAITAAVDELTRDRSDSRVGSLTADWERFFEVLPHGHQAHRARGRAARA